MADLTTVQAAIPSIIVGADATGLEQTPVSSTSAGALHTNLRNNAGTEIATAAAPLRIDPTGTTAQPVTDNGGSLTVDGSVTVTQATGTNLHVVVDSSALPTGASTSALQTTMQATLTAIDAGIPAALGQTTMSASMPVTIASDQTNINVTAVLNAGGSQAAYTAGTSATLVNVSGTNLASRKNLTLYNNSLLTWYWGYTNTVTSSSGTPLVPGQFGTWDVGPSTNIYVITTLAAQNGRVTEGA